MKQIFVMGAYFNTDQQDIDVYSVIAKAFKNKYENAKIIEPIDIENYRQNFIKNNPNASIKEINKQMVNYDLSMVKASDLLFCDVSNKSTGVGIELGIAKENNIKIVFCAKENSSISNMVFGAFPDANIYYYSSIQDIENIINNLTF